MSVAKDAVAGEKGLRNVAMGAAGAVALRFALRWALGGPLGILLTAAMARRSSPSRSRTRRRSRRRSAASASASPRKRRSSRRSSRATAPTATTPASATSWSTASSSASSRISTRRRPAATPSAPARVGLATTSPRPCARPRIVNMLFTTCVFAVVVIGGVLALGGTGMCTDGGRLRERRAAQRGVRREWTTRVSELRPGGDAKLEGTAVADDGELRAPFSGRRCVAYELTLFDFEGVRPVLLARVAVAHSFLLRDEHRHRPRRARAGARRHRARQALALRGRPRRRAHPPLARGARRRPVLARASHHRLRRRHRGRWPRRRLRSRRQRARATTSAEAPYRSLGMRPLLTGSMAAPLLLIPAKERRAIGASNSMISLVASAHERRTVRRGRRRRRPCRLLDRKLPPPAQSQRPRPRAREVPALPHRRVDAAVLQRRLARARRLRKDGRALHPQAGRQVHPRGVGRRVHLLLRQRRSAPAIPTPTRSSAPTSTRCCSTTPPRSAPSCARRRASRT